MEATFVFKVLIDVVLAVILAVVELILVSKLEIVEELTPPTLFTVGASAVPPKSLANFIFPFNKEVASGTAAKVDAVTNAVVAI